MQKLKPGKTQAWAKKNVRPREYTLKALLKQAKRRLSNPDYETLGEKNLHEFRLELKPLRYRAEMIAGEEAEAFARRLNEVQTHIGDWHDWVMVREFAREVTGNRPSAVLTEIQTQLNAAYKRALQSACELRDQLRGRSAAAA